MKRDGAGCPVCVQGTSEHFSRVDGHDYYACAACGSLHIDPDVIAMLDAGGSLVGDYTEEYWEQERVGAIERARGMSLCRAGEAILYSRRPVARFLDVGAGPGFLLRELQQLIDPDAAIFHGIEKYPPPYAAQGPNFHVGDIHGMEGPFDAGVCIEVVEHLTPAMLDGLIHGLAAVSAPGSLWLFNTGMPEYVRNEDPGYLDPVHRGHIISYSLAGIRGHFERHGFEVRAMPGRSFGFFVEYQPLESPDYEARFCAPLPENLRLLQRHGLLYHSAFETARSYYYYAGYLERTRWALTLDAQLAARRRWPWMPWTRKDPK